ncbi:MAG: hypothetical protein IKY82_01445 [Alistipes sp.]|nr:hypothetical protein [Alistipes sp.]
MIRSFKYNIDRKTIIKTVLTILILVAGAVLLYVLYTGGAFSAWFVSAILAVLALMVLSIPQRVVLLDGTLEIQCISDITEINIREIATIRKVEKRDMRWIKVLFGAAGFFGYYGKYFDFKEFDTVMVYASEWNNFVEITDIYDTRIYISCREADALIDAVTQAQKMFGTEDKDSTE